MSESMFVHRMRSLKASVKSCRDLGYVNTADLLDQLIRKVEIGTVKTVTQLDKELGVICKLWRK